MGDIKTNCFNLLVEDGMWIILLVLFRIYKSKRYLYTFKFSWVLSKWEEPKRGNVREMAQSEYPIHSLVKHIQINPPICLILFSPIMPIIPAEPAHLNECSTMNSIIQYPLKWLITFRQGKRCIQLISFAL